MIGIVEGHRRRVELPADPVGPAFAALEAKDLDAFLALLDDEIELVDPHYITPTMRGKRAVARGVRQMFDVMHSLRFDVTERFWSVDGRRVAIEVVARHVARGMRKTEIAQVYVVDIRRERIRRIRAYQPYGPGGAVGAWLFGARIANSARGLVTRPPAVAALPLKRREAAATGS
ncbi:MAG: nuclear transport factor 2 family protein [Chloroflexota bacterium]|nr:nuclear transport factor 2 family protein [Chloroflexota bacterium]